MCMSRSDKMWIFLPTVVESLIFLSEPSDPADRNPARPLQGIGGLNGRLKRRRSPFGNQAYPCVPGELLCPHDATRPGLGMHIRAVMGVRVGGFA